MIQVVIKHNRLMLGYTFNKMINIPHDNVRITYSRHYHERPLKKVSNLIFPKYDSFYEIPE